MPRNLKKKKKRFGVFSVGDKRIVRLRRKKTLVPFDSVFSPFLCLMVVVTLFTATTGESLSVSQWSSKMKKRRTKNAVFR